MKEDAKDILAATALILVYVIAIVGAIYGAWWWQDNQRDQCAAVEAHWVNDNSLNGACIDNDAVVRP
jgi:uncharacterized membrane protein YpjA